MPAREFLTVSNLSGVAASQTATLDLPNDNTYTKLQLVYGTATAGGANQTNMEAELTEFRLLVNGTSQRTFSFAQLVKMNAARGIPFRTGIIEIFFAPPWLRTAQGEDALAWGMKDVKTFQVEIDIGAATNPTLSAKREIIRAERNMGLISKWKRYAVNVSATGQRTWTDFPTGDQIYGLHCFETASGDITDVELKIDEQQMFKASAAEATALYASNGFTDQAGVFHITPNYTQRAADTWETAVFQNGQIARHKNVLIDFTMGAANGFTILAETLGQRD